MIIRYRNILITLKDHSLFNALLEPAVLTSIPLRFCNFAGTVGDASVHPPILNGSFKEPFAPKNTKIQCYIII